MSTRNILLAATLAASLAGCVERGDWKPAPRLEPRSLGAQVAGARLDAAAWPTEQWWRGYGDPQLDALIAEALAGSPSLEIAERGCAPPRRRPLRRAARQGRRPRRAPGAPPPPTPRHGGSPRPSPP